MVSKNLEVAEGRRDMEYTHAHWVKDKCIKYMLLEGVH